MYHNRKIILCGFTSSGKTTIGKLLSDRLELPFYDTDQMLVSKNDMTIPEIFQKGGEPLFRDLEHEIAKQVCTLAPSIISTGGGMLTYSRNGEILKKNGLIFYIDRPFEDCYRNLSAESNRPLFKNNSKEQLQLLYHERRAKYQTYAAYTIKNDSTPKNAVEEICRILDATPLSPVF